MRTSNLVAILRLDAAANGLSALALVAASGPLAAAAGLDGRWPAVVAGFGLAAYAVENALVARRPTAAALTGLIVVDVAFAVAVIALVLVDLTGVRTWLRWLLFAAADLSLVFGVLKTLGRRSIARVAEGGITGGRTATT